MACREIVDGHHEGRKELLDAVGRLCAVQLISGVAGYTLHGQADEDYPAPDQCNYDSPETLRSALATKLFKGVSNDRFTPVHRHIAEFLGARHLAGIIKSGLPARRVIALTEGKDGTVVTEMRGLSAWLAAHCKDARANLIERDPIGVGLYGDIGEFYTDEKRALLKALKHEVPRLDSVWRMATAFGALATPDMEPVLKSILSDSNRDRNHQMFTDFVLRVLREGSPLPNLSELLLKIVRDGTRWPRVNYAALDAFIHNCSDIEDKTSKLKVLLSDIHTGNLSDANNELLGTLLAHFYPHDLPLSEVWIYLSARVNPNGFGSYRRFWGFDLLKKSSDEQVAEFLDNLQQRLPGLYPILDVHLRVLYLKFLARGLKAHGDELDTARLYDWLSIDFAANQVNDKDAIREICSWLEQRPEVQKTVILEGLSRCPESDEFWSYAAKVQKRLYGASPPSDFGLWCLKQAVAMADIKPRVAKLLLEWALSAHTDQIGNEGLSLEVLQEYTQRNETLRAYLDQLLAPPSTSPRQQEWQERTRTFTEEQRQREEQWLEYVRSNEAALLENRAAPDLLHQIALIYFRSDDDGRKAIEEEFRGDRGLIDAALKGLCGTVDREDVPDIEEILALIKKNRSHYLRWPFLAGLAEIERTTLEDASQWDDSRIRKALAFYYCPL